MPLWASRSKEDEVPKPLSLFAFQALHALCSKSKQPRARWAERRLHASSRPLLPPLCPQPAAGKHKTISVSGPPPALGWASAGMLAARRQFKLLLAYSCPPID